MDIIIDTANSAPNIVRNVKTISLVLADGKTIALPITPSLTLRAQENRKTVERSVNAIFAASRDYYEKTALIELVSNTLLQHGLDGFEDSSIADALERNMAAYPLQGELRGYEIGNGLFLLCAWYQMSSGRYELTAYVS